MKIAVIGDVHFGARNSNTVVESWQRRFYEEIFWPYMDEHGIKTIIQTGDYFDNRKWLNIQSLAFQKEVFVKPAQEREVSTYVIVGNHDIPLRHSLANSSVEQILGNEEYFCVLTKPHTEMFEDKAITFMPWICKENEEEATKVINKGGDIIVGHFDIQGALMYPGAFSDEGLQSADFSKWNDVWSGHYHAQSHNGNIRYVGTPYQMMWNDSSTRHGFWIYDTADGSMTFVENYLRYFHRLTWDDGLDTVFPTELKNSYVKITVKKKTDFEKFEKFIDQVNFLSPFEVKITESFEEFNAENVDDLIEVHSTQDLIAEYVDDVASTNTEAIKQLMLKIYEEAQQVEEE